jgi:exodeoxyribonuclease-5
MSSVPSGIPTHPIPYTPKYSIRTHDGNQVHLDGYQTEVIDTIRGRINSGVNVSTLGGLGGTGKSVIVSALASVFPRYAVVAPTNKAVKVLKMKGIDRAQTVHSLVKNPKEELPTEAEAQEIARKLSSVPPIPLTNQEKRWCVPEFGTKKAEQIEGVICDEASMIDKALFFDLLTQEVPLIFTGDHGQLPPVSKDPDDPAFSLMKSPDLVLEKVYRNAGDIARFAAHLRAGGRPEYFRPEDGSVTIGNASTIGFPADSQVLAWKNSTVLRINNDFRKGIGMTGAVCEGDRIMFDYNWNDGQTKVFKGSTGTVLSVTFGIAVNPLLEIQMDDDDEVVEVVADINFFTKAKIAPQPRYIEAPPSYFSNEEAEQEDQFGRKRFFGKVPNPSFGVPIRHAYCLTVHKSQGSEWPNVTVVQDMPPWNDDFRAWAYTAASRAKSNLTWLFDR